MSRVGEIRVDDLWPLLQTRIMVPAVTTPLGLATDAGKATRVLLLEDDQPKPVENTTWGRVVLVPVTVPWSVDAGESDVRMVRFLTLVEFAPYEAKGFNERAAMAVTQSEIYKRLQGYTPALTHALVVGGVRLDRPAQDYPMRDAETRMWYTSAEYLCRVAPKS